MSMQNLRSLRSTNRQNISRCLRRWRFSKDLLKYREGGERKRNIQEIGVKDSNGGSVSMVLYFPGREYMSPEV
jgi:hypothetical protein